MTWRFLVVAFHNFLFGLFFQPVLEIIYAVLLTFCCLYGAFCKRAHISRNKMHAERIFNAIQTFGLVLKKIKTIFVFYLVKLKVAFKNTIFWIWALIHTNHFYNFNLIGFKACSAPTCISIPFSNLRRFFQKISLSYNLGQNCRDKIENIFFSEKAPLSPNQRCLQSSKLLATKHFQIQNSYRGKRENLEFEKLSHLFNLLDFQLLSQHALSRIVEYRIKEADSGSLHQNR